MCASAATGVEVDERGPFFNLQPPSFNQAECRIPYIIEPNLENLPNALHDKVSSSREKSPLLQKSIVCLCVKSQSCRCIAEGHVKSALNLNCERFAHLLRKCGNGKALAEGKQIHDTIIKLGLHKNTFLGNCLLQMYRKCSDLKDARTVFENIEMKDAVSWNTMISAYVELGQFEKALELFRQMPERTVVSYNAMITAYAKLGDLEEAFQIFHQMPVRDVVSWTAMISGCVQEGWMEKADELFKQMPHKNVVTWTTMVTGYAKQGRLKEALNLFTQMPYRNSVSWTAIISCYANQGQLKEALQMFEQMPHRDVIAWTALMSGYIQQGKVVEALDFFHRMPYHDRVSYTAMIMACTREGKMEEAFALFCQMPQRNLFSWTAIISGYTQHGQLKEALKLFQQMQKEGLDLDKVTFLGILDLCTKQAALVEGKQAHAFIIGFILHSDLIVQTALVGMYAKCGSLQDAEELFNKIYERDIVLWTTMLGVYAHYGHGKKVLETFQQMQLDGFKPNGTTIACILSACNRGGLLDNGHHFFVSVSQEHTILQTLEHYNCLIDILGHAQQFDEAESILNMMPSEPDYKSWMSLLASCIGYGSLDYGRRFAERAFQLDTENSAPYVLLSNIYAAASDEMMHTISY